MTLDTHLHPSYRHIALTCRHASSTPTHLPAEIVPDSLAEVEPESDELHASSTSTHLPAEIVSDPPAEVESESDELHASSTPTHLPAEIVSDPPAEVESESGVHQFQARPQPVGI